MHLLLFFSPWLFFYHLYISVFSVKWHIHIIKLLLAFTTRKPSKLNWNIYFSRMHKFIESIRFYFLPFGYFFAICTFQYFPSNGTFAELNCFARLYTEYTKKNSELIKLYQRLLVSHWCRMPAGMRIPA